MEEWTTNHFQVKDWSCEEKLASPFCVVELIEEVQRAQRKRTKRPVVIHCR